ncbi:MAG: RHS repeat-associated core domain-containing protein [Anaerolineaceae bacterium]|nr:RHS repeat-associated core domain-containing protein [Anaerolineaceae bacterium]
MDYKARMYDAISGRFIQPDTLVPEPGSSQGYNRYTYVKNNPINYSDPTGHKECNDGNHDGVCDPMNGNDGPGTGGGGGGGGEGGGGTTTPTPTPNPNPQNWVTPNPFGNNLPTAPVGLYQGTTNTPTPFPTLVPPEETKPSWYVDFEWSRVDWASVVVDAIGLAGDGLVEQTYGISEFVAIALEGYIWVRATNQYINGNPSEFRKNYVVTFIDLTLKQPTLRTKAAKTLPLLVHYFQG